ncbi:MAG: helix-turn-helix domain-containing protein [Solirubrobacterales bacterium]
MTPQERFAINLRRIRTEAGVSQEELGYLCDLHRTEVSLLERAGREPRLATIVKLAGALNTTPAQLCEGISYATKTHRFEVKRPPRD